MKTSYNFQVLMVILILMTGCEKLVEIDPPQDQLISTTVFENDETAISATTGLYANMMKSDFPLSYRIALYSGLYSDELEYKQSSSALQSLYLYNLFAQDALTNSLWINGFSHIYHANSIIEGLANNPLISKSVGNQLLGEALFLRSFWNYYLSNLYGAIPLILTTDYAKNSKLTRSSVDSVRAQILEDLIKAKSLLSEKYVAANSVAESLTERIRPNTFTVSALLARVYLEMNNYNRVEEEATRIISNSKYELPEIMLVFKRTSKEVIWQIELPTATNSSNSYEASMFTLTTKPTASTVPRSSTVSPNLLSLFSNKDKRREVWIGSYVDNSVVPSVKYNYPSKYKTRTTPADEYTVPFRLAEVYLIRAEARVRLGRTAEAINDVDKIRKRSGLDLLTVITPTIQNQPLLDSILIERRRELFCEWSLRWFDIRRSANMNSIMTAIAAQKGEAWKPTAAFWPIPLNDVLNSANRLKQNEGYN